MSHRRDPLGPAFSTNFVKAQRFIQISAAVPAERPDAPGRMLPIAFEHAPTPKKPRKDAAAEEKQRYKKQQLQMKLSTRGVSLIHQLRRDLDADEPESERPLWMVVDGSYTNSTVLKNLPNNTILIGRVRKDAKLYHPWQEGQGRKKSYGERAPSPEELRKDESVPWQRVEVFAAGKTHQMKVKQMAPVLWKNAGAKTPLKLIVIAPLGYRPKKGSRLLYRKPAYLICTDPNIDTAQAVKAYVLRWDIEVNHRDEKQLIGVGEAQVRNENSVELAPAFYVAAYSMLLLAGI